jgi:hypothetical protein
MMNTDAKLFPPRPWWEEQGYRPDEYSRWIKGDWKPIEQLWSELGIIPVPEGGRPRAQPPYNLLPLPRADIPTGIVLSRLATHFIRETDFATDAFKDKKGNTIQGPAIALPLYEGRMIGQFDFSQKGWRSGKGRAALWQEIPFESKTIEPQYLMADVIYLASLIKAYLEGIAKSQGKHVADEEAERLDEPMQRIRWRLQLPRRVGFMDVTSATNERTMIASAATENPFGNSAPVLSVGRNAGVLAGILNTFAFDFVARARCCGLHLNWFVVDESTVPKLSGEHQPVRECFGPRFYDWQLAQTPEESWRE